MSIYKHQDFHPRFAISASWILLCAMIAIVPQIVLRPTAGTEAGFQVFLPIFLGF
ncbi:hypothetical protein RQN30_00525 [Arcanobacterium hippocoleae]